MNSQAESASRRGIIRPWPNRRPVPFFRVLGTGADE
nr:MAG TPA: hypothetical protein [Caudoviricetes sp.]